MRFRATFCSCGRSSIGRPAPRPLMRNALLDLTTIVPATAYHRRSYTERYSRHKHVVHFTPKHGSWLNQVELWFSVFARRFLKRGDFDSAHDFATRLSDYLESYNTHHAHPYRWTYTGQPLVRATPFSQTHRQQRHGRAWFSKRPQRFERAFFPPRPYKRAAA